MGERLTKVEKIIKDYEKEKKSVENKYNDNKLKEKIAEIDRKLKPSELHIQRLEEELKSIPASEKDLIAEYKKKIEEEKNPKLEGEEGFDKDAHYDIERRKNLDEKQKLVTELENNQKDKNREKNRNGELLDLETKQRAILTQEKISIDNEIEKVELNMKMTLMDMKSFEYQYEEKDGIKIPKNGNEYKELNDKYASLQDVLKDLKDAKLLCDKELKKFQEKDVKKMENFTKVWNDTNKDKEDIKTKKNVRTEKTKEQRNTQTNEDRSETQEQSEQQEETTETTKTTSGQPHTQTNEDRSETEEKAKDESGKEKETEGEKSENASKYNNERPNIGKQYGRLDLDKEKSVDTSIRKITCEVGLGKYFVELNNGTVETYTAGVLSKKQAKEMFKLYDIDKKSNIDPNMISILLMYTDKNIIGNPKAFVQEYVNDPNRDFQVVYSDKLSNRHGKIMSDEGVLEDLPDEYSVYTRLGLKQDKPVKPLKRVEKRFLRKMALKQEEHENTFVMMDKRNFLKKITDTVLSKLGKEPKFLPEVINDNERLSMILTSRRNEKISENVNSKISASMEERLSKEMKDEDIVGYEEKVSETTRRNEFVNQYRNVLQKPILDARKEVNEEIIENAKKGYIDRQYDPYSRTKEMLDKRIKESNETKENDEEER